MHRHNAITFLATAGILILGGCLPLQRDKESDRLPDKWGSFCSLLDSIQNPIVTDGKPQNLFLGTNFCITDKGYAYTSYTKSTLYVFNWDWEIQGEYFVGNDTVVGVDDPIVRTLTANQYFSPDHIFSFNNQGRTTSCVGLLAGERLAILDLEGHLKSIQGLRANWPERDYAVQIFSESIMAFFEKKKALWVGVMPSDYWNMGDLPTHFSNDSLFLGFTIHVDSQFRFLAHDPSSQEISYPQVYWKDSCCIPYLDGPSFWGNPINALTCLTFPADSTVRVFDQGANEILEFGRKGNELPHFSPAVLRFDDSLSKRTQSRLMHLEKYRSGEYCQAFVYPDQKVAYRIYRTSTDATTAQTTLLERWDYRQAYLQVYDLPSGEFKEVQIPAEEKILLVDPDRIVTLSRLGWIKRYQIRHSR